MVLLFLPIYMNNTIDLASDRLCFRGQRTSYIYTKGLWLSPAENRENTSSNLLLSLLLLLKCVLSTFSTSHLSIAYGSSN